MPDSIVLFSTADWDNPFWTNKQHMALHLAARGYKILYVESLGLRKITVTGSDWTRIFRRLKRFVAGVTQKGPNLWVYSPAVLPLHHIPAVKKFNDWALAVQLRLYMWRLGFKKTMAWTYNPMVLDLIKDLQLDTIVYHCVDDLAAAPRLPSESIEAEETRLAGAANVVFVTSEGLRTKLQTKAKGLLRYYPNVADYEHFRRARDVSTPVPEELARIPGPRVGFVGAISGYKVDFELIARAAALRPEWNWVLIGKVGEGDPHTDISLLQRPNIHLLGPKSYSELPGYLKGMDATVLPCGFNDYTKSMFPMKFFEYLSAGKLIVATDLPALKPYRDAFMVAEDAEGFVAALEKVLSKQVAFTPEMDALARANTWQARLDRMLTDLELAMSDNVLTESPYAEVK
jgi:glycosyltransferase involved in cell wall biosynthesis